MVRTTSRQSATLELATRHAFTSPRLPRPIYHAPITTPRQAANELKNRRKKIEAATLIGKPVPQSEIDALEKAENEQKEAINKRLGWRTPPPPPNK